MLTRGLLAGDDASPDNPIVRTAVKELGLLSLQKKVTGCSVDNLDDIAGAVLATYMAFNTPPPWT